MNHPTREDWMAYLYGEIRREAKGQITAHLDACDECRANVAAWRQAMLALDAWQVPTAQPRRHWAPLVKWAAAAAVLLLAGFGFGRGLSPTPVNAAAIRAAIEPSLKHSVEAELRPKLAREMQEKWQTDLATAHVKLAAEFRKEAQEQLANVADATLAAATADADRLLGEFAKTETEKRAEEKQILLTLLKELEAKFLTEFAATRKDLETVAVLTELGLRSAQQEIVQLASDRSSLEK